jgi:hypothetical protein
MRRLLLLPALAAGLNAQAADPPYGRLFYTPQQRAALEDARRRNIRAEELAAEAAKQTNKPPVPRKVLVSGVVQRSDGTSVAWVNGKPVESETRDGLRVRHGASSTGVVVYDPEKRRTVAVKVGQQVDLNTGRIEESYETRRAAARAAAQAELDAAAAASPAGKQTARTAGGQAAGGDSGRAAGEPAAGVGDERAAGSDGAETDGASDGGQATEGGRDGGSGKQGG